MQNNNNSAFIHSSLSTDLWPQAERWSLWKEHIEQALPYQGEMSLNQGINDFHGRFEVAQSLVTSDALSRCTYTGNQFKRNQQHIQDGFEDYLLAVVSEGEGVLVRGQQIVKVKPGGIYLLDLAQTFVQDMYSQSQVTFCRIPRMELEYYLKGPKDNEVKQLACQLGAGSLLNHYLKLLPTAIQQASKESARHLFRPISDLVIASLIDNKNSLQEASGDRKSVLFSLFIQFLQDNCFNPSMSVDELARKFDLSHSYIHSIFRYKETCFSQELRKIRIEFACKRLNHGFKKTSLTDLALDCGFNSLSQFSRAFKAELGVTASDFYKTS